MYYWDGATWVSAVSPDGRYRWNGTAWEPLAPAPPAYAPAGPVEREPTSWTRPLQYAVAAWYLFSAVMALSLPFWMSGQMSTMMRAAIQQSEQQNPYATPPPPGFVDAMTSMLSGVLWFAAFFGIALSIVAIVGALRRWTWLYYAVLVLLGLGVVSSPLSLVNMATGAYSSTYGYTVPTAMFVLGIVLWFPETALFVVMLIALIKRGPWGMTRGPAGSPAA